MSCLHGIVVALPVCVHVTLCLIHRGTNVTGNWPAICESVVPQQLNDGCQRCSAKAQRKIEDNSVLKRTQIVVAAEVSCGPNACWRSVVVSRESS